MQTHKIKVYSFTSELEKPLNPDKRLIVTTEVDCFSVENPVSNDEDTETIYKTKVIGSTIVQELGSKEKIIGKSKRSPSQRLRARMWQENPDETYYNIYMDKLINNWTEIVNFLKNL